MNLLLLSPQLLCCRICSKNGGDIPVQSFIAGVLDTGHQFITGVVDTRGKFIAGVVDTGDKLQIYY